MFNFFKSKGEKKSAPLYVAAICDGQMIRIEEVGDPVFSSKMMGEGYAIIPTEGTIVSPLEGTVTNVFPTKHAIALKHGSLEVLVHLGLETVSLNGAPFTIFVKEGDPVALGQQLATVDLRQLKDHHLGTEMIVVFPNGGEVMAVYPDFAYGPVKVGETLGEITLK